MKHLVDGVDIVCGDKLGIDFGEDDAWGVILSSKQSGELNVNERRICGFDTEECLQEENRLEKTKQNNLISK